MLVAYLGLVWFFVVGACVGSFLNVAIARLPLEKSLLWPGSRCGKCYQSIRWYDNIPLVSYLWLRGRCRSCGQQFSPTYLAVELFTALGFAGLYYFEVMGNCHDWPAGNPWLAQWGVHPWHMYIGCAYHATLFSFLMAVSVCDLRGRIIPFSMTFTGMLVGLMGSVLMPWPWPWPDNMGVLPRGAMAGQQLWMYPGSLREGLYPWPLWGPLPSWMPEGSWQLGLATGVAGVLMGTFLLRTIGFIFSSGLGKEGLGLGDADLMMMVGAFLGWQAVVVGFFLSVIPALFIGVFQYVVRKDNSLPFGPSLAAGSLMTCLSWHVIGPYVQPLFFWGNLLLVVAGLGSVILLVCSLLMRLLNKLAARGS